MIKKLQKLNVVSADILNKESSNSNENNNSNSNNSNNNSSNDGNKNMKDDYSNEKSDIKEYLDIQDVKATSVLKIIKQWWKFSTIWI